MAIHSNTAMIQGGKIKQKWAQLQVLPGISYE